LQKYISDNGILNDAEDKNWPGRARLCCFTKQIVDKNDMWVSNSSVTNIVDGKIIGKLVTIS
jgi:hypothetical protein